MLIIISGLPGTGKTTLAAALAKTLGIAHLNSDMLRDELGKRGAYDAQSKEQIYREMQKRTEKYLQQGKDIIVDATFYKTDFRRPYLQLATQYETPLKWVEMEAGEAIIKDRVSSKRAYSEADFAVYQKIKKDYEPLSTTHLVLSSERMTMEDMLKKAAAYLAEL